MTTKTELETKLAEVTADFEAFKDTVVKKALAAAKRYDWCEEVQATLVRMGLEDRLPSTFAVQEQDAHGATWTYEEYTDTQYQAIRMAKTLRKTAIERAKRQVKRRAPSFRDNVYVNIGSGVNIADAIARIKEKHDVLVAAANESPEFVAPEYPKYRAVELNPRGKVIRVLETFD